MSDLDCLKEMLDRAGVEYATLHWWHAFHPTTIVFQLGRLESRFDALWSFDAAGNLAEVG